MMMMMMMMMMIIPNVTIGQLILMLRNQKVPAYILALEAG